MDWKIFIKKSTGAFENEAEYESRIVLLEIVKQGDYNPNTEEFYTVYVPLNYPETSS